ncbi:IPT/TIG domain-containing protein [Ekhidna sp.]|uniref:IPT/TIG domain-containing protein n=1 Tax=Ekhidna sp. TaxID=2608089 RepID=UPI0032EBA8C5
MTLKKIISLYILIGVVSCNDDNESVLEPNPPTITTGSAIEVENGIVILSASFESNGNEIEKVGFEYGTSNAFEEDVVIADINIESNDESFEHEISSDLKRTTYFYRAFLESDTVVYGSTKSFTFSGYTPSMNMLSPNSGQISDSIKIIGQHFLDPEIVTSVYFSGVEASIVSIDDSNIEVIVPSNLEVISNTVWVMVGNKASEENDFTLNTPSISAISPDEGFDGSIITLSGSNFSWDEELNKISIQGIEAEVTHSTDSEIQFIIPDMEFFGTSIITLSIGPQETQTTQELVIHGPIINQISTQEGYPGDTVLINGEYFTQNGELTEIYFGEYKAVLFDYDSVSIGTTIPVSRDFINNDTDLAITVVNGLKRATSSNSLRILKSWELKSSHNFDWSWLYKGFSFQNKGYIVEVNADRLYSYDPSIDQWSFVTYPINQNDDRNLFIPTESSVLKMGGQLGSVPIREFWEYHFADDRWVQKDDLPFEFNVAHYFQLEDLYYIITNTGQVWSYDHRTGDFSSRNNIPTTFEDFAFPFIHNDVVYLITKGTNWQYDATTDTWSEISRNDFSQYTYTLLTLGFYYDGNAYVLADGDELFRYDFDQNKWNLISYYPCDGGGSYKSIFVLDNGIYFASTAAGVVSCSPLLYKFSQ